MAKDSPSGTSSAKTAGRNAWIARIAPYQRADVRRASWQLVNTVLPYLALWVTAYLLLDVSYWLSLVVSIVAAGFQIRTFIISHDCGHGSFFKSTRANGIWGRITSFLVFLPYHSWRHAHAIHHAHSGDLDNRGVGDVLTLTVEEYQAKGWLGRFWYRVYRNPIVLFIIGPVYLFIISHRFWPKGARSRVKWSVIKTNLALAALLVVVHFTIGFKAFLLVQVPITVVAGTLGVWLFYVQHQFDGIYWRRHEEWNFYDQAVYGSSYYKLPKIFQFFSGNIGFHHIHHLGARIPNYFLEDVQREVELFHDVKPLTVKESLRCINFRLWDEENRRLIGFSQLKDLSRKAVRQGARVSRPKSAVLSTS